jgi:hypothetical protein
VLLRAYRSGTSGAARLIRRHEATWLVVLVALVGLCLLGAAAFPDVWPVAAYIVPLVLAMNVLSTGQLLLLELVVAGAMALTISTIEVDQRRVGGVAVIVIVALLVMYYSVNRQQLGVASLRGESMLIDLRDRLASQSQLPVLPRGWSAEAVMRSAGGASFAGDFIVAAKTHGGDLLEVAVVDVSGKGVAAGTRALLLSGAFGGLLGAIPPEDFLPAANQYLIRQEWSEGFATAVHLALDLSTGKYEVRTAGHPPPVQFHAGSGRWVVTWTEGPALGVTPDAQYSVHRGEVLGGDALMLYTDGLVETPRRDITYGIDKLVGEAERLVPQGFEQGASRLVASVESQNDDRALLLLHRR